MKLFNKKKDKAIKQKASDEAIDYFTDIFEPFWNWLVKYGIIDYQGQFGDLRELVSKYLNDEELEE